MQDAIRPNRCGLPVASPDFAARTGCGPAQLACKTLYAHRADVKDRGANKNRSLKSLRQHPAGFALTGHFVPLYIRRYAG